jgi:hypothetical protein
MNPAQSAAPAKRSWLPGNGSLISRVLVVSVGLLVLLIGFTVIKNIVAPGPNYAVFTSVIQDQQALVHLTDRSQAATQSGTSLSINHQNFAVTAHAAIGSSESQTIAYLTQLKQKINAKQLDLKISPTVDSQLSAAATAGTYDSTFQTIMNKQLDAYKADLSKAYDQAGPHGKVLIKDAFDQAKLLQAQLTTTDG